MTILMGTGCIALSTKDWWRSHIFLLRREEAQTREVDTQHLARSSSRRWHWARAESFHHHIRCTQNFHWLLQTCLGCRQGRTLPPPHMQPQLDRSCTSQAAMEAGSTVVGVIPGVSAEMAEKPEVPVMEAVAM